MDNKLAVTVQPLSYQEFIKTSLRRIADAHQVPLSELERARTPGHSVHATLVNEPKRLTADG